MQKLKIALIAVLALLTLIVVLQNTKSIETKILFIEIDMPLAALLFVNTAVGFVLGAVVAGWVLMRRRKN
jgi:uncharacterized integral membrane protein